VRRGWKILLVLLVVALALLIVNASVTGSETRGAEVTAEGGEIMELSSVDLQVTDSPATISGPEKAPLVLLHCYGCSLHWWDEFVPLVNEDRRVIRFDLIGFGGSQKPGSGYSMEDQARAVAEGLNQLGVEGAVVVGHSMGGLVAAALAENSSELVDRVAVIGTASDIAQDASLPFSARLSYAPLLGEAIWRVRPSALVRKSYESAFAPGFDYEAAFGNPDQVILDSDAMTYTSYEESASETRDFTDAGTIAARFTNAAVPLLAILGSEDQIVDTEATAEEYATVPGARVEVLEGIGHSAQLEDPERTAQLIESFAAGAPAPAQLDPIPDIRKKFEGAGKSVQVPPAPTGKKPQGRQSRDNQPRDRERGGKNRDG
jgi:pimeloyl-ACP methyl ester carboxylesterase